MRMTADQLGGDFLHDLLDLKLAALTRDLRVHHDEQHHVAQFLAQIRVVGRTNGVRHFVSLLEQLRHERLVRLLAIPGTTIRSAELGDHAAQFRKRLAHIFQSERCAPNSEISPVVFLPT